jgi:hypothetical protein
MLLHGHLAEHRGAAQLLQRADLGRDHAEHGARTASLREDIGAESRDIGNLEPEIDLVLALERGALLGVMISYRRVSASSLPRGQIGADDLAAGG